jgi:phosphoserine phosphatase RsbU/P
MPEPIHGMTCMEIHGGNVAVRREVAAPGLHGWIDSAPYQQAAAGGDVYYLSNCATGRITRLLLADVSGHGAAVAGTADRLRLLMRRYVNHVSQGGFVSALNAEFAAVSRAGGFATAVAVSYFAPTRTMTFSNAGHPAPLVRLGGSWQALEPNAGHADAGDLPLGLLDDGDYAEQEVALQPGDLALLYSDAWMEARDASGAQLGVAGLLAAVQALAPASPRAMGDALRQRIAALHPENLLDDDATLVIVQAVAGGETVPWRNRLLAPGRLLQGFGKALLQGGRGMPFPEISVRNLGGAMFERLGRTQNRPADSK